MGTLMTLLPCQPHRLSMCPKFLVAKGLKSEVLWVWLKYLQRCDSVQLLVSKLAALGMSLILLQRLLNTP